MGEKVQKSEYYVDKYGGVIRFDKEDRTAWLYDRGLWRESHIAKRWIEFGETDVREITEEVAMKLIQEMPVPPPIAKH